eukprot:72180_1
MDTYFKNTTKICIDYSYICRSEFSFLFDTLFLSDCEWINMVDINILFPRLEKITIEHVNLSEATLDHILFYVKNRRKQSGNLTQIVIFNPNHKSDLMPSIAISKYKKVFEEAKFNIGQFVDPISKDEWLLIGTHFKGNNISKELERKETQIMKEGSTRQHGRKGGRKGGSKGLTLRKPPRTMAVKLEDSNMANYGTDEHKQMRTDAAGKEEAWQGVGKECGILIWRIEKFKVVAWPKKQYGEFYDGDSYIILHTYKVD